MKKIFIAILALIYISTSAGATLHMHYCMGKLADWGLGHNKSKTCSKCGMEKSEEKDNGCCKDEHKFLKNNIDQKAAESSFQVMQVIAATLPATFVEIPTTDFSSLGVKNSISHAPPRSIGIAVYIRNCVFRI